MKKIIFAALAAAAVGTASATYKVDEYHANVRFAIDHFNTSTNVGGFYGLTGSSSSIKQNATAKSTSPFPSPTCKAVRNTSPAT